MLKPLMVKSTLVAFVCSVSFAAHAIADESKRIDVPAGELVAALETLSRQAAVDLVFQPEQLKSFRTGGVTGTYSPSDAIRILLQGTPFQLHTDASSGAMVISARSEASPQDTQRASDPVSDARPASIEPTPTSDARKKKKKSVEDSPSGRSDDQRALAEVVVTATKRQERLQDVPMSIAVISNQDIERRGVIGMEDYLRSIPGVNQIDNGAQSNAIVIRGVATSPEFENAGTGSGSTVATYFDETPITAAGGVGAGSIDVRPVDIERIEVLRGPQGTTYGSASLGGAMRIIPVKPKLDAFGVKVAAAYSGTSGSGGENSMMQGIVNLPVIKDEFGLRAVGYRYNESGFYRNTAGIDPATLAALTAFGLADFVRDYVRDDVGRMVSTGGRLAALWQATDRVNLAVNFLTQKIEQDGTPVATSGKYAQNNILPVAPQVRTNGEIGPVAETKMDLVNLVLNYDMGWSTLTSVASWIDSGSEYSASMFTSFPFSSGIPSDFRSFSAETRLTSHFNGPFQLLGGLFYENVDEGFHQTAYWPVSGANPFGTNPLLVISDRERGVDQRAVFGEVSYDLTDKLSATVGGRYFKYEKDERVLQEGDLLLVPFGTGTARLLANGESGSSFKANLNYKPTEDSLLYASWAEGFRLGRPAAGLPSAVCDRDNDGLLDGTGISIESTKTINSDFLENYEIGGKFALFDQRVVIDTSVYHIKWDGLPIRALTPPCPSAYVANVGGATSDGVELQASLVVVQGLRVDFGAGYIHAELSKDALGLPGSPKAGARLPGSPKLSANLAVQYGFSVAGYPTFVRADSFYAGKFYGDLVETPTTLAGDYVKVDARAGMTLKNLSVELFVRNLTNEDAFTWRGLSNANSSYGYRLRPRTIGIQLGYSFE